MKDRRIERAYLGICKVISEQSGERVDCTSPEYKGPRQITCSMTDPKNLAVNNEMTYEEFYDDLLKMVNAFKLLRVQVIGTEAGMFGGDSHVNLSIIADIPGIVKFLKTPTIGASIDPDVASVIYDLSDGSRFPDEVDEDPIGILLDCPLVKVVDVDEQEYFDYIRNNPISSSNVEKHFLSEEYLNEARRFITGEDM